MHVYVQNWTTTTWPRRPLGVSGCEFSHPLAPSKDAYGSRNLGALDVEEAELVLPVETTRGNPRVRDPGHRDVVEDLVSREVANGVARESPRDVLITVRVVVEHPGGEGGRRIGEAV